jgi:hypothetical protein
VLKLGRIHVVQYSSVAFIRAVVQSYPNSASSGRAGSSEEPEWNDRSERMKPGTLGGPDEERSKKIKDRTLPKRYLIL